MPKTKTRIKPDTDGPASVRSAQTFPDASGYPVVLDYRGYVFACDLVGEQTLRCIGPRSGSRTESKIAANVCRAQYARMVAALPGDYVARNAALYAAPEPTLQEALHAMTTIDVDGERTWRTGKGI